MGTLLTGATGFVGSHLAEALVARGARVRALVRESSEVGPLRRLGIETVSGSLRDETSLRRAVAGAHTVFHLAAATRALDPSTFHAINAEGTAHLVAAMEAGGGDQRLVYLSSMAAVGPSRGDPVRPDDAPHPLTAYGRSKLAGEAAIRRSGLGAAILRAPAVYGPGDRDLLPFFRLANRGVLPVAGPAGRRVQMVHVADLVAGLLAAGDGAAAGTYHVAEPEGYAWKDVLGLLAGAVGRTGVFVPVPGPVVKLMAAVSEGVARVTRRPVIFDRDKAKEMLAEWLCDTASARRELEFEAAVPLAEGLQGTADWYRATGWL